MAGLQRSTISFRRQGSSGLVWDDKVLSGDLDEMKQNEEGTEEVRELRTSKSVRASRTRADHLSSATKLERSQSEGGGRRRREHQTARVVVPVTDPPSPKVSVCGFCAVFKKPEIHNNNNNNQPSLGKRKS